MVGSGDDPVSFWRQFRPLFEYARPTESNGLGCKRRWSGCANCSSCCQLLDEIFRERRRRTQCTEPHHWSMTLPVTWQSGNLWPLPWKHGISWWIFKACLVIKPCDIFERKRWWQDRGTPKIWGKLLGWIMIHRFRRWSNWYIRPLTSLTLVK